MIRIENGCERLQRTGIVLVLSVLCGSLFLQQAKAQCSAQDFIRGKTHYLDANDSSERPRPLLTSDTLPVWKTIKLGATTTKMALWDALETAHCGVGTQAEEMLVRPEFKISKTKLSVDLVYLSVDELGIKTQASLADIYSRAEKRGLVLAAAEVGPQLRLHYFEQPLSEFLNIGMEPITPYYDGGPSIFTVANGGAGLLLLSQGATEFLPSARFVFVRPTPVLLPVKDGHPSPTG